MDKPWLVGALIAKRVLPLLVLVKQLKRIAQIVQWVEFQPVVRLAQTVRPENQQRSELPPTRALFVERARFQHWVLLALIAL